MCTLGVQISPPYRRSVVTAPHVIGEQSKCASSMQQ